MLGTKLMLITLGAWFAIAPVVAVMVGRALKAADPYAEFELRGRPATVRVGSARPIAVAPLPRRAPAVVR